MSEQPFQPLDEFLSLEQASATPIVGGDMPEPAVYSFDNLPDIPAIQELKHKRQWVAWKHEVRNGQATKMPVDPHNNRNAKVNKPETWGSYEEAVRCALRYGHAGVGYVLIKDDDISGHDLDKVIDPVTGALPDWVQEIIDLGETYTEVSPSGRGIRMFWRGKLPSAIKLDAAQVEIYSTGRYLTVTGHRIASTSDEIGPAPKTLELLQARVERFKEAEARTRSEEIIIPASKPRPAAGSRQAGTSPFWRNVKDAALADLGAWVPDLCGPAAVYQPGTGAWRISSAALGRGLQEDLAVHPDGIRDFGIEKGLTAIDLVMWRNGVTSKEAAFWLCDRMRRTPESLGWDHNNASKQKLITHLLDAEQQQRARDERAKGPFADEAREVLRLHLEKLMASALAWHGTEYWFDEINLGKPSPPHDAIKITTGVGKSRAIRRMIARFIRRAKRKGLPHRVLYAVSTHKLASEAQKMMLEGITTTVWQGRGGTKINTEPGEPMCNSPERVEAAKATGSDIERTACRKKRRGQPAILCPFYPCHYQRQKAPAGKADVVLCAHELLFKAPPAIGDGFGLVVADEAFWAKGLSGVATKSRLLISGLADDLKSTPVLDRGTIDPYQTMELRDMVGRLQSAFDQMPDGFVTRQQLINAGLQRADLFNRSSCEVAETLEWARKPRRALLQPNSSDEQRNRVVAKYSGLGRVKERVAMWKELGALVEGNKSASGRLRLETVKTEDGEQRYIRVLRRKKILEMFAGLPLIHLDATMPFELVKHYLPELQLGLDLDVKAPHMHLTQIAGLPVGKSSLQPLEPGKRTPEKELEAAGKRKRLVSVARHLTRGRRGLLIAQMNIEDDFKGIDGTATAHYGAIEGRDCWKDAEVEVIIGRPLPSRRAIENMAAALTGRPVIAGDMVEQVRPIGTTGHALRCKVYVNPDAEMIRQATAEAGVRQAEGRVRAVNRTAANPVEVYVILSDTVVPGMPVDEVANFQDIEPDAVDLMIGRGVTLEAGTDAHTLCPDLFPSPEAARVALHRAQLDLKNGTRRRDHQASSVTFPYNEYFIRECNAARFCVVRYQKTGDGQKPRLALIDLVKFPDPRAALEPGLGPLARFEVIEPKAEAAE